MRRGFLRTDTSHRQIDICCQKYISGEYTSLKEGASHLPFGQQQFLVYVKRYKEKHPAPADLGVVTPTPPSYSNREYIDTLKKVSAAVAIKERGTDGARSTAQILKDMGCTLLKAAGVNKYIAQDLAGKSPKKRGRPQILQKDAVIRIINYVLWNVLTIWSHSRFGSYKRPHNPSSKALSNRRSSRTAWCRRATVSAF
jgi:hypothetical protein